MVANTMSSGPRRHWLTAPALLAALAASPAAAQTPRVPAGPAIAAPPQVATPTITLDDAVRLTVSNDPQIKLQLANVTGTAVQVQQAAGAFDWNLQVQPGFTYTNAALDPGARQNEVNRRLKLQATATAFGIVNRTLLDSITQAAQTLGPRPPRCPLQFSSTNDVLQYHADPLAITFPGLKGFENTRFTFEGGVRDSLEQFRTMSTSVCAGPENFGSTTGMLVQQLQAIQNTTFRTLAGTGLNEAEVTLLQSPLEVLGVTQQIAQAVSTQAALALGRLGVVPRDEVITSATLNTAIGRRFRNGVTGSLVVQLHSDADNFKDKSLDPNFGGLGKPILFGGSAFAQFVVPVGRGRGIAVSAPEKAARLTFSASNDQLRHTTSEEAFRTVVAYLGLVGAQETVRSLEDSTSRQDQIANLTQQLVNSGDLPAVESGRVQARAAAVRTSVSEARRNVTDARIALAEAMGVDVATIDNAPRAADTFMTTRPPVPNVDELVASAQASRFDLHALTSLREAARVLERGAWADARPRFDLTLKGGYSTFYDDLTFYYLPDEVNPIFTQFQQPNPPTPSRGAVPFSSPTGFYRALFERQWRPLFAANFTLQLPFRNNALRGRAAQAEAARQRAEVQQQDLSRVIRENIVSAVGALRRQADAIERQQAAVAASQQTLDAALQRFQQADVTLIDTLLTEEFLTRDRLTLVNMWQDYLSQLARLKFEAGTLLSFNGPDITPEQVKFNPVEFVQR